VVVANSEDLVEELLPQFTRDVDFLIRVGPDVSVNHGVALLLEHVEEDLVSGTELPRRLFLEILETFTVMFKLST
jgi:hypothetical protein